MNDKPITTSNGAEPASATFTGPGRPVDQIFPGRLEAIDKLACASCKRDVAGFRDKLSASEYAISGLCQLCQDRIFREPIDDARLDQCAARMLGYYQQIRSWLAPLGQLDLYAIIVAGSYIAGGAIASFLDDSPAKDVDVFFDSQATADYVCERLTESVAGIFEIMVAQSAKPVANTDNALTIELDGVAFQFIKRAVDSSHGLRASFDFEHTCGLYRPRTGQLEIPSSTLEAIIARKVVLTGSSLGMVESYDRALRFKRRGWLVTDDDLATLRGQARLKSFSVIEGEVSGSCSNVDVEIHVSMCDGSMEHRRMTIGPNAVRLLARLEDHGFRFREIEVTLCERVERRKLCFDHPSFPVDPLGFELQNLKPGSLVIMIAHAWNATAHGSKL